MRSSKKSSPGKFAYTCHFQQIGINATKIEKTGIHFKTDVFAAVAVVDAKAPYYGAYPGTYDGGKGAFKKEIFRLNKGTVLNIVVGQRGGNSVEVKGGQSTSKTAPELGLSVEVQCLDGGGGGSFVYTSANSLLLAAGGGGGESQRATMGWRGRQVLVVPAVVWGKTPLMFEGEGLGYNPVSVILSLVTTMSEWVQVG